MGHACSRGLNVLSLFMVLDAAEKQALMVAGCFLSVGRAVLPAVRRGLTSAGQVRVMAHQRISRRKLFPSPLSPVSRFRRRPKSSSMSGAGPTLLMPRCVIMACVPFSSVSALVCQRRRTLTDALPGCSCPPAGACQSFMAFFPRVIQPVFRSGPTHGRPPPHSLSGRFRVC